MKKAKQAGWVKASAPSYISTNDLRFQFKRVLAAMKRGVPLTLTYRNKPLAKIVPVQNVEEVLPDDDPVYHFHELAEPMGSLTNRQIDEALYRDA